MLIYRPTESNNNEGLVQRINPLTIETVHMIMERWILIIYILADILLLLLYIKYIVDCITEYTDQMVAQSFDDYSKIETLFGGY